MSLKANKDQAEYWKHYFFSHFVCSCGNEAFVSFLYFYSHLMNVDENYVPQLVDKMPTR